MNVVYMCNYRYPRAGRTKGRGAVEVCGSRGSRGLPRGGDDDKWTCFSGFEVLPKQFIAPMLEGVVELTRRCRFIGSCTD